MADKGSSVPRRQLGRHLRQAREAAGITLDAAARELECSRARMYRIEAGHVAMRTIDVRVLCGFYGIDRAVQDALVSLAREGKARGWWHAYGDVVPSWFELYVGLEAAASRLRHYETALVPGLLQTPEYAAAAFGTRPDASVETVAQAVALRLERQKLLTRRHPIAPRLEVILDEAVIRRPIPDPQRMAAQLHALVEAGNRSRIEVRLLPATAWPHRASIAGSFVILGFPETRPAAEPTTVYVEGLTGALYLDKPEEVAAYDRAWEVLGLRALDAEETADLLTTTAKEMTGNG